MESMTEIRTWLRTVGAFIYTKNRLMDLDLMEEEIKEAYRNGLLDVRMYQTALLTIKRERRIEQEKG
ncbi:YqgQ family protein [Marinococcus halophilus]|nr:YqgQ family protein [Marinococcus halophilus]